jgi:hypothetical protein
MSDASTFLLKRAFLWDDSTIGELYDPSGVFLSHTLEDAVRNVKVDGKTAIPAGTYTMMIGWSNKRQRLVPFLLDVPFFEAIQIHPGNSPADSRGCILPGKYNQGVKDWVANSQDAFDRLFPIIRKACEKGETKIQIMGGFEAKDWIRKVEGAV